jgi:DNA-binding transcriptional LysR family regulator
MDWDKLRVFHAVAAAGSFTHAGETLNLSQSAVSRQIHALEDSLGIALFHRHARGLILTEQGELLHRNVREIFAKLAMTEAMLTDSKARPQGPLKITTTVAFGSTWLTPQIKEFMDLYPDIEISLILLDTELDLSMREADCAIRFQPPRQPDLIQRQLKVVRSRLYASPDYLKAHGMPTTKEALEDHQLIVYGEDAPQPTPNINWLLAAPKAPNPHRPVLKVNNIYGIYRAVMSGVGIAALPSYMTRLTNNLVHVVPELEGPEAHTYFVYAEELRQSKRIGVFRDYLVRKVAEAQF